MNNLPLLIAPELLSVGNVFHSKILFFPFCPLLLFPQNLLPRKVNLRSGFSLAELAFPCPKFLRLWRSLRASPYHAPAFVPKPIFSSGLDGGDRGWEGGNCWISNNSSGIPNKWEVEKEFTGKGCSINL